MISKIRIRNLRSIQDSGEIELRKIMILLGANSSGKSTFLRSFPLFTQSVDKKLRGPIAWFDMAYVDYGDFKTAMNKYAGKEEGISFDYKFENLHYNNIRFRFLSNLEYVSDKVLSSVELSFTLKDDSKGTYVSKVFIKTGIVTYTLAVEDREGSVRCTVNGDSLDNITEKFRFNFNTAFSILPILVSGNVNEDSASAVLVIRDRLLSILKKHCNKKLQNIQRLERILFFDDLDKTSFLRNLKKGGEIRSFQKSVKNWSVTTQEYNVIYNFFLLLKLNYIIDSLNRELAAFYHKCDYIAPMRAAAGRFYRIQGLQVQSVDPSGNNLLEFIASLTRKEKQSYDEFTNEILGITVEVPSESGMKSLRVKTKNGDFSIADVGYGYSQVLPVITKLWHTTYVSSAIRGFYDRLKFRELDKTVILMEQPELHLHPVMQAKIADTLIKTSNIAQENGQKSILIVETHSQTLVNRIGRRIREGKISPADVNVLTFQKDAEFRNTIIKQISFDENGQLKDWPYGFFDPQD